MAVIWEDDFHDTTKIKTAPDTRKRIKQWTDPGLIMGDEVAMYSDLQSVAEIDAFFDNQSIPAECTVSSVAPAGVDWLANPKVMKLTFIVDPAIIWATLENTFGTHPGVLTGGWKDCKAYIYMWVDNDVRQNINVIRFSLYSMTPDQTQSAVTMILSCDTTANFLTNGLDSGIPVPTDDGWVKLEIEIKDNIGSFHVTSPNVGKQTSNITKQFEGMFHCAGFLLEVIDDGATAGEYYFEMPTIETHLEQDDDDVTYPYHQHEFKTVQITDANWYQWDKINLTKINQSLPNESFITVSVLDSIGTIISGYDDLVSDEIDISDITQDIIILHIKFWSKNSYVSPILETLAVTYFTTGGEVTLAVTANTYNDDIVTPVTTKTGYRITFDATAATPSDPDLEVTHYWFDFGDGLNTGWITNNEVNHVYNKHSQTVSEAGADKEWNARAKVKFTDKNSGVTSVSGWSNLIDLDVLNSNPVARLWASPIIVRMSGAGPSASVTLFGDDSYDVDDNGSIATSGGYKFDLGEGDPEVWQDDSYLTNVYSVVGTYVVGLTVKDDLSAESSKITTRVKILAELAATLLVFDRMPKQADIDFDADLQITRTIAGGYPDVEPTTALNKSLKIIGQGHLKEDDITLMQGYLENGTLVQFNYNDLDGVAQNFTGYIKSLRTGRRGGFKDDVPWSATIQYKAV